MSEAEQASILTPDKPPAAFPISRTLACTVYPATVKPHLVLPEFDGYTPLLIWHADGEAELATYSREDDTWHPDSGECTTWDGGSEREGWATVVSWMAVPPAQTIG